jgi:hypothetical protein
MSDEKKKPEAEVPVHPVFETPMPKETGGTKGPEPTRYGDWEHKGRCTDF